MFSSQTLLLLPLFFCFGTAFITSFHGEKEKNNKLGVGFASEIGFCSAKSWTSINFSRSHLERFVYPNNLSDDSTSKHIVCPPSISSYDLTFFVSCPGMGECGQYLGAGGSEPAGYSHFSLPEQHGGQSLLLESEGKVPQTVGCAGGSSLSVCSLGQTKTGRQHICPFINVYKMLTYTYVWCIVGSHCTVFHIGNCGIW